jgi:hypothetical protein
MAPRHSAEQQLAGLSKAMHKWTQSSTVTIRTVSIHYHAECRSTSCHCAKCSGSVRIEVKIEKEIGGTDATRKHLNSFDSKNFIFDQLFATKGPLLKFWLKITN